MKRFMLIFWFYWDGEFDEEVNYTFDTLEECHAVIEDEESSKDMFHGLHSFKVKIYQEVV